MSETNATRYAVIMAGGSGKRLWPLSRRNRPKQVLHLVEGKSLIEISVARLEGLFDPEHILVVTNVEYVEEISRLVPAIPKANLISEPVGRNTANAIALAAAIIAGREEKATMAVFTADHVIRPIHCFAKAVQTAMDTAEANPQTLLTFGIRPTWPHTGLGYIEADELVAPGVYRVSQFKEKPEHAVARSYVESGRFFWNSGMFVWTIQAIREALQINLAESVKKLDAVTDAIREGQDYTEILQGIYPTLDGISIDYAVMEHAADVLTVELQCEWIDLGSWPSLEDVVDLDGQGNAVVAGSHVVMDGFRNVVVSDDPDHLVALLGMDDCIVVHSADATLICKKSDSQRLKELVAGIEQDYGTKFL